MVHILQYVIRFYLHNEHIDFIQNKAVFLSLDKSGLGGGGTDNRSEMVNVW